MVSAISLKIFYFFIPPPTMTHVIFLISLFPMLEQMLIIIPFSHTLRFWNSLPPTLAHAPSTSVFKRLIEFYVKVMYYINLCYFMDHCCMCRNFYKKKKKKKISKIMQHVHANIAHPHSSAHGYKINLLSNSHC